MNAWSRRVGLDGLFLSQPTTGSGQYALHLWRYFASHDPQHVPILLQPEGAPLPASNALATSTPVPSWARSANVQKLWWEQRGVPATARRAQVSLLHIPYFAGPLFSPVPTIMTIHDVIPLLFPQYGGSLSMRFYLRLVSLAARRAAVILTDSECSRRDIHQLLGIPTDRIRAIPLAADERFRPIDDPESLRRLRAQYGLPGQVVFNVGGLDVRKNLGALIEAFARALPDLESDARLVIAGKAHSTNRQRYPPLEPLIQSFGLQGRVVLTGAISDDEKLALLNLADVYVYPSLYEGFGLSPLEAMACGTPVISSDRSSLPEVVGRGGLLVDPSPDRLAAAMVAMLTNGQVRREMGRRGLDQAERFSWRATAEQTRQVYDEVLAVTATSQARVH